MHIKSRFKLQLLLPILLVFLLGTTGFVNNNNILDHEVDLTKQKLAFFWKNKEGCNYRSIENLINGLKEDSAKVAFAMNGGMYNKDLSPQGLYIENGIPKSELDTLQNGYGNFYMQPNGIFHINKENIPGICKTPEVKFLKNIKFATQSGPMLIIEGKIHPRFKKGSSNLHIRNGVGILPNGNILFAMSKERINFYDFAMFFKNRGCKNALYLDGFVSRTYLPEKNWIQKDGNFGVIIAEIK